MQANNKATWIWYPGDFEIWLGNIFNNRRTERGAMLPPFWKQDSHYVTVEFSKSFALDREETITIAAEGKFNLALDGKLQSVAEGGIRPATTEGFPEGLPSAFLFTIPAGEHRITFKVWNQATPPALFVDGDSLYTDSSWLATYEDKLWIDENGVAHGSGIYVPAARWHFNAIDTPPSQFKLERQEQRPVSATPIAATTPSAATVPAAFTEGSPATTPEGSPEGLPSGILYDFGRETFGYLKLKNLQGTVRIYYGESREEALDTAHCETLDVLSAPAGAAVCRGSAATETAAPSSKAFRFVYIEKEDGASYDDVSMDYEYAPYDTAHTGSFRCSDDELNRIWDVAAYTMDLTTREFFMDGIKRDRWTWSGDAIQSYLMNYYLRFDTECVKRTIRQLRGKDPVTAHVNTIMDYTFYWFKSILDYYQYTGDVDFVREMWPRMVTLMNYVEGRLNSEGMAEGQSDDWIFVDWVDFPMHKRGVLCFEQILLCKALETMALCAKLVCTTPEGSPEGATVPAGFTPGLASAYRVKSEQLRNKVRQTFWSYEHKAYYHALENGVLNRQITKFPNMFAILYGYAYEEQRREIMQSVMLNPAIDPITTPYMRFYELETLCIDGLHTQVLQEMRSYWGGMLREGATSFWEKYVPSEKDTQHLAMYGRPYGKSLCHAWGASPIYLLGKYYLGVQPTKPGYEEFEVRPALGDLEWMEGDVPTPQGLIHVYMDKHQVKVKATGGGGWLVINGQRIQIEAGKEVVVNY